MILVTGATGNVGSEVVKALSSGGHPVRALVRDPNRAASMAGLGVELAQGDMEKPETLERALEGIGAAFLLPPIDPRSIEMEEKFIDAARQANVRHIVKLSSFGAATDSQHTFGRWHGQGEKLVEASGIPFTHLRPNSFMQNLLAFAGTIAAQGAIFQPAGDAKISHVDVRDIAAVAARTLTETGHEGRIYEITGPEALTYFEIAEKVSAAIGKPVHYVPVSPEDATKAMLAAGLEEWRARAIEELFGVYRRGEGAQVTNVIRDVAEKDPISFGQFARDYARAFQA